MEINELVRLFTAAGCRRLFAKVLAKNNNSKNQIYLGSSLAALNLFPTGQVKKELKKDTTDQYILKSRFDLWWLSSDGHAIEAPQTQLVYYPQYPEVRLSGFLKGCHSAPSDLLRPGDQPRVLFLGVTSNSRILGYVVRASASWIEALRQASADSFGVLLEFPIAEEGPLAKRRVLAELRRIHLAGWIEGKRLNKQGVAKLCADPNAGGYTLEAEFGVVPNSKSKPDFLGWEIKHCGATRFDRLTSKAVTLLTPEPDGGFYHSEKPEAFVRRFGYPDQNQKADRFNFGGRYHVGKPGHHMTHLHLELVGFSRGTVSDASGGLVLLSESGEVAASWSFAKLLNRWQTKHAYAVYVPALCRKSPNVAFFYGDIVGLGEGTTFELFLQAMSAGVVYYDPSVKLMNASTAPTTKSRNQFRVGMKDLACLYSRWTVVNVLQV